MIFITNKHRPDTDMRKANATVIYCGRGSALGNPFIMRMPSERNSVCDKYNLWLSAKLDGPASPELDKIQDQLEAIMAAAKEGDVALQCFCTPRRCHCETIKAYVEQELYHG
jgi:hypothetical protein